MFPQKRTVEFANIEEITEHTLLMRTTTSTYLVGKRFFYRDLKAEPLKR